MTTESRETILKFLKALNDEDFKTARAFAADEMKFEGVMGSRDGAEAYFADMEKMRFKYDIKRLFADGDDVAVFYDINMGKGEPIFTAGWYHVTAGKINTIRVVFDPRPLNPS